jgi:hypothetical protein
MIIFELALLMSLFYFDVSLENAIYRKVQVAVVRQRLLQRRAGSHLRDARKPAS